MTAVESTPPALRNQLFMMMLLQISIWGAWQPKIFAYMTQLNFTVGQQTLAGSVFGIAAVVGMFFSNQFADRNFAAERFLAGSHLLGGLALLFAAFQREFEPFICGFLIYGLLYLPTISVTNSVAFTHLKNPAREFGLVRMGGTVGWIVASWPFVFLLAGETVTVEQTRWIIIVGALLSFAMAAFSLTLPHTPPKKDTQGFGFDALLKAVSLLKNPVVLVLFIVTFIDSVVHNGYFVLSDNFLTDRVGIRGNLSMVVMSLGQMAEIVTMVVLGAVLTRLGWKVTMLIGILGHVARFAVFALLPDIQPVIIAVQLLHGICYAFFFATLYIFVDAIFPKDIRTSAQGLFNLLILGVGMVVAAFLFPLLREHFTDAVTKKVDYRTLFLIPTGMAALASVLLALLFHPPKELAPSGGDGSAPAH
jgi:nucleoside transporter